LPPQPDLERRETAAEQAVVDRVYDQLDRATRNAQALAREGHDRARLGHEGGLVERDAMVFQAAKRIATLNAAHEGLVFGRLDLKDPTEDPRYIGRIGLRDDDHESLLVDWRAPAAAVFYQATPADPQGVVRRRVLRTTGRTVLGVEDDLLDPGAGEDLPVIGEGALLAQLSRARDRSMHSIVATIQAEQDKAIRAPSRGVVEISGGPGTGKTVVALHRAAYLLYTDRARYERGGVLVVGPSGVFMRYIERVLPSLGETAVALRSVGEVVDGIRATRHDPPAVADVKGSAAMAELLRRTARQAAPEAPREFRYFYRDDTLQLSSRDLGRLRRTLLAQGPRNRQVPRVASALVDALWRQVGGERALERSREEFTDILLGDDRFLLFVRAWWPPLDATEVLGWLRDPEFLARVGEGVLDASHQAALAAGFGPDLSVEDVPLVDELRYLLGDLPDGAGSFEAEPDPLAHLVDANMPELTTITDREFSGPRTTLRTEDDTYAHVLVDEAQDLTPMQWRMVGRRGPTATWTVVGDPAQSSWPFPEEADRARQQALGDKPRHRFRLATNYRNSAEIYRFAAAYAERAGLVVDLPDAVRSTGADPVELQVDDLAGAVAALAAELLAELPGTVGVVAPTSRLDEVKEWLQSRAASDPAVAGALHEGNPRSPSSRLVVLTGIETKGLEFDGILVVAPAEIEAESVTGRSTAYVALTRATQRLVTVSPTG
jgi:DNA helicase IV